MMGKKKIKVNCEFVGIKNGRLNYKYKECKKSYTKVINGKNFQTLKIFSKDFYNNFNLENISDKDYKHTQKVWKTFEIKNLGEYHDLYVQCDTLLLADVF